MPSKSSRESDPDPESDDHAAKAAAAIAAAIRRAEAALDSVKQAIAGGELDDLGEKAAAAASTLYREGQKLMSHSEGVEQAKIDLTVKIRRNPLASVGIAFVAGLLLALLTRG